MHKRQPADIVERQCIKCGKTLPVSEFYKVHRRDGSIRYECICRSCGRQKSKDKNFDLLGGKVMNAPGKYINEDQRKLVFELLKRINWRYSERTKIWYKNGIKDKNGNWLKVKGDKVDVDKELKSTYNRNYREKQKKSTEELTPVQKYHQDYWKIYYQLHRDEINAERRKERNSPRKPPQPKVIKPIKRRKTQSEYNRKWRNKPENIERMKQYRAEHREYMRQYNILYREKINENKRNRRNRNKDNEE